MIIHLRQEQEKSTRIFVDSNVPATNSCFDPIAQICNPCPFQFLNIQYHPKPIAQICNPIARICNPCPFQFLNIQYHPKPIVRICNPCPFQFAVKLPHPTITIQTSILNSFSDVIRIYTF